MLAMGTLLINSSLETATIHKPRYHRDASWGHRGSGQEKNHETLERKQDLLQRWHLAQDAEILDASVRRDRKLAEKTKSSKTKATIDVGETRSKAA